MRWLSDTAVNRLRRVLHQVTDTPDTSSTKYRLVQELARGGMGTVYLAEDTQLSREVALKVLHWAEANGEAASRMLREARIIARLEHPGIVPVHDVGALPDGRVFYAMKLVRGRRLDESGLGDASRFDLLRLFQKACEAVAFAHAHGVIHRDLKPENIMVGSFGEVLIMDWGVAKLLRPAAAEPQEAPPGAPAETASAPGTTPHGTVVGTPAYMAPEQALGLVDEVDERSDVYALGAILYFLLSRRSPDPDVSLRRLNPTIPRSLEAVCLKALAQDRRQRYESAHELGNEVARLLDGQPVLAYRESLFERLARLASRHRTPILLVLAYLLMRTLLLFFSGR